MPVCCKFRYVAIACVVAAMSGCSPQEQSPQRPAEAPAPQPVAATPRFPLRLKDDFAGLHNLVQVSEGIISGSEPHGSEGFGSLARLGIKTVVSVDGARPDLAAAREQGMRYVHIPIGYDGVPELAGQALTRLVRDAEGPVYIHCHHGRHRGPAAAVVAGIAAGTIKGSEAIQILESAGTGKEYAGLWRDVEKFAPPPSGTVLPELVEVARVESLTTAMVAVDRQADNLKACRDANWQTPPDARDLDPAHEAVLLREALREANRAASGEKFDATFRQWLEEAESLATQLETDLVHSRRDEIDKGFQRLEQSCQRCHVKYRN